LDIKPETFVTPLIHGIQEEDWMDAFWVLFDSLWAVECAVTQRYVDIRRQTGVFGSDQIGVDTDEMLEQLWQARTSLVVSIFHVTGPMTPSPALMDALATTLLDWNTDLDSFLSRQDSAFVSLFTYPKRTLTDPVHRNNAHQYDQQHLGIRVTAKTLRILVHILKRR
jgi:hypothetical protein